MAPRVQTLRITCPTRGVLPPVCPTWGKAPPQAHRCCLTPRHAQYHIRWTPAETSAAALTGGWCGHWWHNSHTRRPAVRCHGRRRPDSYRGHRVESRTWCISSADAPRAVSVAGVAGRQAGAPLMALSDAAHWSRQGTGRGARGARRTHRSQCHGRSGRAPRERWRAAGPHTLVWPAGVPGETGSSTAG